MQMQICTGLTSLSPHNNLSKSGHNLFYGKTSFAVLVPCSRLPSKVLERVNDCNEPGTFTTILNVANTMLRKDAAKSDHS